MQYFGNVFMRFTTTNYRRAGKHWKSASWWAALCHLCCLSCAWSWSYEAPWTLPAVKRPEVEVPYHHRGIHGRCNHTNPVQSGYTGATGPLPRPLHMGTDEGQAKEEPSISLVRGTICNIHFSIGGNIIPTVREQAVKSLGRLYAFPLTDRHRGVEVQRTALEGLHAIEKSELPGKLKAWCFQHGLLPCLLWPLHIYEISLSRVETIQQHINKYLRKWLCVPPCFSTVGLYTTTGMLQLPSYPSQKNSRLEKLGSTWCCGTHRTTSYAKYSLKLELELSGQLLKRCKKQKPASRSKKSLEPPRREELA